MKSYEVNKQQAVLARIYFDEMAEKRNAWIRCGFNYDEAIDLSYIPFPIWKQERENYYTKGVN